MHQACLVIGMLLIGEACVMQEMGLDCCHWTPATYHDLMRCGDGSAEGLLRAYFETVRTIAVWQLFKVAASQRATNSTFLEMHAPAVYLFWHSDEQTCSPVLETPTPEPAL